MTILEIDAAAQTSIERDLTDEEIAQKELDQAENEAKAAAEADKAAAKAAVLSKLGITEDELRAALA